MIVGVFYLKHINKVAWLISKEIDSAVAKESVKQIQVKGKQHWA
jgi:hypothetical protein